MPSKHIDIASEANGEDGEYNVTVYFSSIFIFRKPIPRVLFSVCITFKTAMRFIYLCPIL